MFGVDKGKKGRDIIGYIVKLLSPIWGWLLIVPVAVIVPKRRDYIAVIGKHGGKFVDNGKYFFLQGAPLVAPNVTMAFITDRRSVYDMLIEAGPPHVVMFYPSLRSILFLLRAGTVVFESNGWHTKNRGHLLIRAQLIQLWHGVGFKKLYANGGWQRSGVKNPIIKFFRNKITLFVRRIRGVRTNYAVFNTTSIFYREEVFKPFANARKFTVTGYPRNTFGDVPGINRDLLVKNVDPLVLGQLDEWARDLTKVILFSPTYRTDGSQPMKLTEGVVQILERFGKDHNVVLLFKLHPVTKSTSEMKSPHVFILDSDSDIYPIMPRIDAMITDYSSIYVDYLLVDRPIHFYVPDSDKTGAGVGELQMDFDTMTPGPKVQNWEQLLASVLEQWSTDTYVEQRANLRRLAFDDLPQQDSVPKILDYLAAERLLRGTNCRQASRVRDEVELAAAAIESNFGSSDIGSGTGEAKKGD